MCVCVCVYARTYVFKVFFYSGLGYGGSEKGALNLQFSATSTNTQFEGSPKITGQHHEMAGVH